MVRKHGRRVCHNHTLAAQGLLGWESTLPEKNNHKLTINYLFLLLLPNFTNFDGTSPYIILFWFTVSLSFFFNNYFFTQSEKRIFFKNWVSISWRQPRYRCKEILRYMEIEKSSTYLHCCGYFCGIAHSHGGLMGYNQTPSF